MTDREQIAALVGVAPMNYDSGTMRGQRHIRGGIRRDDAGPHANVIGELHDHRVRRRHPPPPGAGVRPSFARRTR